MAGINTTKAKANETAEEHIDKKIELEDKLILDLVLFFTQLAEDYAVIYSTQGKIMTLTESYEDELKSLLKKNYRNVSAEFGNQIRKALEDNIDLDMYEPIPERHNDLRDKIGMSIGAYLLTRSNFIAPRIANTVQNEMVKQTNEYIVNQAARGVAVKQAEVANAVKDKIKEWGENHAKVVSTTEVQTVAEQSKFIENEEVNELCQSVDTQVGSRKVWITAGDEKVRTSHLVLDGKSIDADEMFVTGLGSIMRYAGDMENGASLSDVINCRCTTVYKYNTQIIKVYRNTMFRRKGI